MNSDNIKTLKKDVGNIDRFISKIPCSNPYWEHKHNGPIVAIGDIHGDFEALIYVLYGARLINESGQWIGRNTFLVQTGDLVDDCRVSSQRRCHNPFETDGFDELIIIDFLADLAQQAERAGGKVLLCMGNHEFMNIVGDKNSDLYVQPETLDAYTGRRREIFAPGGILAKKLACLLNVVVKVNDWIFMHGGLRPSAFPDKHGIYEANEKMKLFLQGKLGRTERRRFLEEIDNNWFFYDRTFSQNDFEEDDSDVCAEFDNIRRILRTPKLKMVVGHTPAFYPNSICNGSIFRIDTAMSRAFGPKKHPRERLYALRIVGDDAIFLVPHKPGVHFHVFNSHDLKKRMEQRGLPSKPYKSMARVDDYQLKIAKRIEDFEGFLEEQENINADEAFIY